jgi:hypothetical protein
MLMFMFMFVGVEEVANTEDNVVPGEVPGVLDDDDVVGWP